MKAIKTGKKTKTILLAEDEEPILTTLCFILRRAGYKVLATSNGEEALERIIEFSRNEESIDLLVTDIQMAHLTGMQLIDELNTLKLSIPVLVITGYGNKETVVELLRKGCMEYIDKPFKPDIFLRRVEEVLEKEEHRLRQLARDRAELQRNFENYKYNSDRLFNDITTAVKTFNSLTEFNPSDYAIPLAHRSLPLSHLGGDLFLVRPNTNGYDLLVADVAGHDMGTSYYAVLIKSIFDDVNRNTGDGIRFLSQLNNQLKKSTRGQLLITAVFISLDLKEMQGEAVLAGHHTPIIMQNEEILTFPSGGNVIGILDEVNFKSYWWQLVPGQRIFLYTDGIINATRHEGAGGETKKLSLPGLKDLLKDRSGLTLQEMIDHVFTDILFYCHQKPGDDMLLLGAEIPEQPEGERNNV